MRSYHIIKFIIQSHQTDCNSGAILCRKCSIPVGSYGFRLLAFVSKTITKSSIPVGSYGFLWVYEFRRGFVDSRCKITARESKFCKKSAATEAFRRQQSRVQTGNVVLVKVSSNFSNKLIFVKIIRNRKTCTRRVPEAHSFLAQKWRNREFTIW